MEPDKEFFNNVNNICCVDCDIIKNRVDAFQDAYGNVYLIIFFNIIFFLLFYLYIILEKNKKYKKYLNNYFFILKYYSFYVFAVNLFYFYLFIF